jgi:UDPglucose--hexose-1-phosphate uridylyltransferase
MGGCGAHEVLVESPDHGLFLAQQPIGQVQLVLQTLQSRYRDLMEDRRFQSVMVFKNHGVEAGSSVAHPHWQLIATPVVPRLLRLKHFEASQFFDRTGQCLYCLIREQELAAGKRVLATNSDYVAFMPYASHSPFETWIVPRHHNCSYTQVSAEHLWTLAELLKAVLWKLHTGLGNPAFNLTIDDVPRGEEHTEYFLWHIRILPRLTTPAGFELGNGMSINTVLPEDAAAFLSKKTVVEDGTLAQVSSRA